MYGPWQLLRSELDPKPELSDDEYIASLRLEPMWEQGCSCGFQNIVRRLRRPTMKFDFNGLWRR
ncbi:hypothetical protein CMI37_17525 [Candidatus Pacearchaeota archaeon]|jgi:hypothetical protein|nr:hypothetical protein [Candidatus Pacearchaeota archaeon]|tara:strand:- start:150 stop:341 length:192 start_codon:yes stop_codon:yes gene_type:complete